MKAPLSWLFLASGLLVSCPHDAVAKDYLEIARNRVTLSLIDRDSIVEGPSGDLRYLSLDILYLDLPPGEFNMFPGNRWDATVYSLNCEDKTFRVLGFYTQTAPDGKVYEWMPVPTPPASIQTDNQSAIAITYRVLCEREPVKVVNSKLQDVMRAYQMQIQSGMLKN